ncbi:MAG: aminoglycoside phosphotransferase family protein, partial [Acidimicrobiales bacterium]|nr:aminoglycoside phosphotransferase family protein [Acidimicrobiales bacterium]
MSTQTLAPDIPILNDPAVPSDDLLGDGAPAVIGAVLDAVEATVVRSRPAQTTYYAGRSLTVRHEVKVRWADGSHTDESIVVSAGRKPPRDAMTITDGDTEIVAWRVPHDPWLPGLAPALSPEAMSDLFERLGLPSKDLRSKLRAYRPGRRAVVEVTGPGARAFLKIVPPRKVEKLHRQHEALAGPLPVPASLGWSEEHGIVVLQALPGRTLREAMLAGFGLPDASALLATLDRLPAVDDATPDDVPVDWRAHEFADLIGNVAPELDRRLLGLADGLRPFESRAAQEPVVPVHGDFYEAQLLVDGGRVTGLLDVDTFGAGRRVNDLATMIGHLSVLALGSPKRAAIERYAARL